MTVSDKIFTADLIKSDAYTDLVVQYFLDRGHRAVKQPLKIRPTFEQRFEYADDGDIYIYYTDGRKRVESKPRPDFEFDSIETHPYYDQGKGTAIVCECYRYDDEDPKPDAFCIIGGNKAGMIVVHVENTKHLWTKEWLYDRRKKDHGYYYMCPLRVCTYHSFEPPKHKLMEF